MKTVEGKGYQHFHLRFYNETPRGQEQTLCYMLNKKLNICFFLELPSKRITLSSKINHCYHNSSYFLPRFFIQQQTLRYHDFQFSNQFLHVNMTFMKEGTRVFFSIQVISISSKILLRVKLQKQTNCYCVKFCISL